MIWRLLGKSQDSFILALEIINKVTVPYRIESFCYLFINSWELLLKANLVKNFNSEKIYKSNGHTIDFNDCLNWTFKQNQNEYLNLKEIYYLRNNATHLFINFIPPSIMAIFQAGVRNYDRFLNDWFRIDITKRIPEGMMFLIVDTNMINSSVEALRKKLSSETLKFLSDWQSHIKKTIEDKINDDDSYKFYQKLEIKLAYLNNSNKADLLFDLDNSSNLSATKIYQIKDPDKDYPYFTKEIIEKLKSKGFIVNSNFVSKILPKVYNTKGNDKYCYVSEKHYNRPQYSHAFYDWLLKEFQTNSSFIEETKKKMNMLNNCNHAI